MRRYIGEMHRLRRFTGALSALFILNLVFLGSGYACALPGAESGMANMGMLAPGHPGQPTPTNRQTPCQFPWAPDGCQSMAPCAPAALASPIQTLSSAVQPVSAPPVLAVLTPPSETSPPELPPPRS